MPQKGQHIRGNNCARYNKFRETQDRSSLIGLATWNKQAQRKWAELAKIGTGMNRYDQHINTILQLAPENSQVQIADICGITRDQVAAVARAYNDKTGLRIPFKGSRDMKKPTNHDKYIARIKQLAPHHTIADIALKLDIKRTNVTSAINTEERKHGNVIECKKAEPGAKRKPKEIFEVGGSLLSRAW